MKKESKAMKTLRTFFYGFIRTWNLSKGIDVVLMIFTPERQSLKSISDRLWTIDFIENKTVEVVFSKRIGDVSIHIENERGDAVYDLRIPTLPTLHVIIDIQDWDLGIYSIVTEKISEDQVSPESWTKTMHQFSLEDELTRIIS